MRIVLIRVGADQTPAGGRFNGPVDTATDEFVYVGIPETKPVEPEYARRYDSPALTAALARLGAGVPEALRAHEMHLDPDFEHGTYGDHGRRAAQLSRLERGDVAVFYASLRAVRERTLVYALIGQLSVQGHVRAREITDRSINVHAQRRNVDAGDVVVVGSRDGSGRYERCIPVGELRDRAYRVRRELLHDWGGLSVSDGFLQRSAVFPRLLDPAKFLGWLAAQRVRLVRSNH